MSLPRWITILVSCFLLPAAVSADPTGYALVVGIEDYPGDSGFESVPGSDRDARDLAAALDRLGFEVIERRGSQALRKTISGDLRELSRACSPRSGPFLLFFSGRAYGRSRGDYLASFDARSHDLEMSGVDLESWRQVCPGIETLLLLDVSAEVRPPGALTMKPGFRNQLQLLEIRAAAPGRETYFDGALGGRVFARTFLSVLEDETSDGAGIPDPKLLAERLDRGVRGWSFDRGVRQSPQMAGDPRLLPQPGLPAALSEAGAAGGSGQPITLSLKDADLQEVLRSFARLAGVNMVIDPGVRGRVTVELHEVPWDQALEVILKSHGLGAVVESSTMRVEKQVDGR